MFRRRGGNGRLENIIYEWAEVNLVDFKEEKLEPKSWNDVRQELHLTRRQHEGGISEEEKIIDVGAMINGKVECGDYTEKSRIGEASNEQSDNENLHNEREN